MKKLMTVLFAAFAFAATAQTKITAAEASKHVGDSLTVCGKVFGGRYFESGKDQPTLINIGGAYPENPFTMVIYGETRKLFKTPPEEMYKDKTICVTGVIKDFKGKPQIVITKLEQIAVE